MSFGFGLSLPHWASISGRAAVSPLLFWIDGSAGVTSTTVTPRYTSIPGLRLDVGTQSGATSAAAQPLNANALRFSSTVFTSAGDVGGRLVNFSVPASFSVEGWIFPEGMGTWWRWIDWGDGESQRNIIIAQDGAPSGTTAPLVFMYEDALVRRFSLIAPGALNQNVWVHVACTYDATTRRASLYVNGELLTFATSTGVVPPGPRTNMYVGRSNWASDSAPFYRTAIRVYDYALSNREIVALCTGVESDGLALYTNPAAAVNNVVMPYTGTSAVNWLVSPTRLTRNGAQASGPSVNLDGPTAYGTSYDIRFALGNWSGDGLTASINGGSSTGVVGLNGQVVRRVNSLGGNIVQFSPASGAAGVARITALRVSPSRLIPIEYLVIAGGGAGGSGVESAQGGAGGGAGGVLQGSLSLPALEAQTVTVGAGGVGAVGSGATGRGGNGGNSIFTSLAAIGGGGGGAWTVIGNVGGSGGGSAPNINTAAAGTAGQGFAGGIGSLDTGNFPTGAGGGGGAGGAGGAAGNRALNEFFGGAGGVGVQSSITGVATWYASGGGGGGSSAGGVAPPGGGGNGVSTSGPSIAGTDNTGGGGGGGFRNNAGGNGGSGVVILAYPDSFPPLVAGAGLTVQTITTRPGWRVYRFTAGTGQIGF